VLINLRALQRVRARKARLDHPRVETEATVTLS